MQLLNKYEIIELLKITEKNGGYYVRIYLLLLIVMAIWGFNVSALVVLVHAIDPITLTAVRVFVAGIGVLMITKLLGIFRLPTKDEWKTIMIITLFNVALHHSLLAIGLTATSGVNASIIIGSAPIITMVFSILLLRDQLSVIRIVGFLLGFIGIFFTSLADSQGLGVVSLGDVIIFLSITSQAFSFILISKLNPSFDTRLLTGYMLLIGSIFIFIFALFYEGDFSQITRLFSSKLGAVFLFSAIVATAFGHMVYNYAVREVGPAETAIFANLNTLFALLGSVLFLGESVVREHYIGLILIVLGVFIGTGTLEYLIRNRRLRSS